MPGATVPELPTGTPIPAAGTVTVLPRRVPTAIHSIVRYYLGGMEITHLVKSANWRVGQQLPNRIGGVMRPADGHLLIDDLDGELNVFNPSGYDPYPGATILIQDVLGRTLFTGYSAGALNTTPGVEEYTTTIPIFSSLTFLAEYGEGFFARMDGQPTVAQVLQRILSEMEYTGHSTIQDSGLKVHGFRLNRQGALGAGRSRASFLDACRLLAVLEGGYIYDDQDGRIWFESAARRFNQPDNVHVINRVTRGKTLDTDRLVVNRIEGRADPYTTAGEQDLPFVESLPLKVLVPAQTLNFEVELNIDPAFNYAFIESWSPLVRGTHYDWSLTSVAGVPVEPFLIGDETSCRILFANPTNESQEAIIYKVRGEPFTRSFGARLAERDALSIKTYGPKTVQYPIDILVDQAAGRGRARFWIEQYKGLRDGNKEPIIPCEITVRNPDAHYRISDMVLLTWVTEGKEYVRDHPFWIDAVAYSQVNELDLDVSLTLRNAGGLPTIERLPPVTSERLVGEVSVEVISEGQEELVGEVVLPAEHLVGEVVLPQFELVGEVSVIREHLVGEVATRRTVVATERLVGEVDIVIPDKVNKVGDLYYLAGQSVRRVDVIGAIRPGESEVYKLTHSGGGVLGSLPYTSRHLARRSNTLYTLAHADGQSASTFSGITVQPVRVSNVVRRQYVVGTGRDAHHVDDEVMGFADAGDTLYLVVGSYHYESSRRRYGYYDNIRIFNSTTGTFGSSARLSLPSSGLGLVTHGSRRGPLTWTVDGVGVVEGKMYAHVSAAYINTFFNRAHLGKGFIMEIPLAGGTLVNQGEYGGFDQSQNSFKLVGIEDVLCRISGSSISKIPTVSSKIESVSMSLSGISYATYAPES